MLTTDPLELVSLVVLKDKSEEVSSYLLHAGFFHPVDTRAMEGGLTELEPVRVEREYERFDRLRQRAKELARRMSASLSPRGDLKDMSVEAAEAALDARETELASLLQQKEEIAGAARADEAVLAQVKEFLPFSIREDGAYSFLYVSLGRIEEKSIPVLQQGLGQMAYVLYPFARHGARQVDALFIGLRRDREALGKVLSGVGWQEEKLAGRKAVSEEAQKRIQEQVAGARARIAALDGQVAQFRVNNLDELSRIGSFAELNKSLLDARRNAASTRTTVIFSGWVPVEDKGKIFAGVSRITETSYVESRDARASGVAAEDIPVRFAQSALLRPFGLLVGSYGVPRYGTVDPTFFVALAFVFMFGLMFGDLGQGLVFAAIGGFLLAKARGILVRQFAALLLYCGSSAALFGFLQGSAFGVEFHSVFPDPMRNVSGLLSFSVYAGIAVISLGIAINIVNALRDRDYARLFFDKSGLIGGLVYWAAIAVVIRAMFERGPVAPALYVIIGAGMGALFIFPLVDFFLRPKHGHGSLLESFMESLLGLLEFAMGYLANTVSFVRMGAFALAHAALLLSVFQIARMFHGSGSLAVIIAGNVGVMILEGVVVSIQSLRLNYYEFFSRFFVAGKAVFKPLSV